MSGKREYLLPLLENECGGHRWQRIPPTEKRGRVQTSSVTVAIWDTAESAQNDYPAILDADIDIRTQRGSGPGGQHRNKTDSCVFMRHIPTGITAQATGKCQHQNRRLARELLERQIMDAVAHDKRLEKSITLKEQKGSGMRGDKIRTYRERDNLVIASNGKKVSLTQVKSGKLHLLWD